MPKYKVTATMDVGYELIVEAPDEDTAWEIAKEADDIDKWVQADDGHDWTLENVWEIADKKEEEVTDNWIIVYSSDYEEWQVSDGPVGNRGSSYDFKTKEEAEQFLKELRQEDCNSKTGVKNENA